MKEFSGKSAIVTGTTGIGRAIAVRFADAGAEVVACGIDGAANQELSLIAANRGLSLRVETCDVTDVAAVRSVIAKVVSRCGGLDIIINAAAVGASKVARALSIFM